MARDVYNPRSVSKFVILNLFGCFIFFVPITIKGTKTIPLDHMLTAVQAAWPRFGPVSAIAARLYPLNKFSNRYYAGQGRPEVNSNGNLFHKALEEGIRAAYHSRPLHTNMWMNLKDGILMDFRLIPIIISIGLLSFLLAKQTPVFDYVGCIYYPITRLLAVPEAFFVAKATAVAGAEMFIPSAMVAAMGSVPLPSNFIIGVMSVSILLFFSGSIPCIPATDVRFSILDLVLIMVERAVLTLVLVAPPAHLMF